MQEAIQQWPDLLRKKDPLPIINRAIPQILELRLYQNALLCQAEPGQCQHIRRTEPAMKTLTIIDTVLKAKDPYKLFIDKVVEAKDH